MRLHRHPAPWTMAFAIWFAVLWWLSSLITPKIGGPGIPHFDKVLHFCYFAAGGFLMLGLLRVVCPQFALRKSIWTATALVACVGIFDELHQLLTPGRSGGDIGDWLADALGGAAGACAGAALALRLASFTLLRLTK